MVALAATIGVLGTLSPSNGPGITVDEYYDVAAGKKLVQTWLRDPLGFFRFETIETTFGPLTRHPPLGRWLLGWAHALVDVRPDEPQSVSVVGGRIAPAVSFGLLIALLGWFTSRAAGPVAGLAAAASVALVPRLFGHAHFATLDMMTALFWIAALFALAEVVEKRGSLAGYLLAGFVWGLALLVKMHGVLLIGPGTVLLAWFLRRRALGPWFVWCASAGVTFFAGWPWLWPEPWTRLREYLGTSTDRAALHVYYLGRVWSDQQVPWHYAWLMFVATMPLGLLVLGALGAWEGRGRWIARPRFAGVALGGVGILIVFSLPGVPVYDGVRLFLMVPALWAFVVGIGVARLAASVQAMWQWGNPRLPDATLAVLLLVQGIGIVALHPFYLSHYSLLVGSLPGAMRLGFEATYWGDAINGTLLRATAQHASGRDVLFAPHLAPFQAAAANVSSAELIEHGVRLVGWDATAPAAAANCRWALVYRRRADLDDAQFVLDFGTVVAESARQGEWLARLYRLPSPAARLYQKWEAEASRPDGNRGVR